MSYVLENLSEFDRLEKQSQFTNYDYKKELADFKIKRGAAILDAGCGSGIVSRYLATTHADAKVTAIDFSEDRLGQARKAAAHIKNISFSQGDLTALQFNDNTFDHIVCRFVLQHLRAENKNQKALSEMFRVLKPGGTLLVIEVDGLMKNLYPQSEFLRECMTKLDQEGPVDLDIGRKINSKLHTAGFEIPSWKAQSCDCKETSLQEETYLMTERLASAKPFFDGFFRNTEEATLFCKEYLRQLQSPEATYSFTKYMIMGKKPLTTKMRVAK